MTVMRNDADTTTDALFWTGSYTDDFNRDGVGIGALSLSAPGDGPRLRWLGTATSTTVDSPSFLAVHPSLPLVYTFTQFGQQVQAFRRTAETALEPVGEGWPADELVCHIAIDPHGRYVVVSCYGGGAVILYELDSDGAIVSRIASTTPAADPHADRGDYLDAEAEARRKGFQPRMSRAHAALILPDGRIMTTDLGFDLVRVWNYEPATAGAAAALTLDVEVALPLWSGPRHLTWHPGGFALICTEYSVEVATIAPDPEAEPGRSGLPAFTLAHISPATKEPAELFDAAAEISLSADNRFAYVTVRNSNRIGTVRIDADGSVHPVGDVPTGADWPRHHRVHGRSLMIAHENSSDISLYDLDPESGLPSAPVEVIAVGAPTAIIPM